MAIAAALLALWLAAATLGLILGSPDLLRLKHRYDSVDGKVIQVTPEGHGFIMVKYSAAGRLYEKGFAAMDGPRDLAQGDSVRVYFLPSDPRVASIADPAEALAGEFRTGIFLSISFSLVAACVVIYWLPAPPRSWREVLTAILSQWDPR